MGTPVVMLIYFGVRILFKIKYTNRWITFGAGIVWLAGFIMVLYVGVRTLKDFNKTAKIRETITVVPHEMLYLKMHETPVNYDELNMSDKDEEGEKNFRINNRDVYKRQGRGSAELALGRRSHGGRPDGADPSLRSGWHTDS